MIGLVKGAKYFAGYNRPFFITQSMIANKVRSIGGTNIQFHTREQKPPINPLTDPHYNDDWDEWLSADYNGPTKNIEQSRLWSWAVRKVGTKLAHVPAPPPPKDDRTILALGGVGMVLLALVALRKR